MNEDQDSLLMTSRQPEQKKLVLSAKGMGVGLLVYFITRQIGILETHHTSLSEQPFWVFYLPLMGVFLSVVAIFLMSWSLGGRKADGRYSIPPGKEWVSLYFYVCGNLMLAFFGWCIGFAVDKVYF